MLSLVGLKDSYVHDGRVLIEYIDENARPQGLRHEQEHFLDLAKVYKQLNAPLGSLGLNSLILANRSVTSDDVTYGKYLTTIAAIAANRDALASKIKLVLDRAAFNNQPINEHQQEDLGDQAKELIEHVEHLAK